MSEYYIRLAVTYHGLRSETVLLRGTYATAEEAARELPTDTTDTVYIVVSNRQAARERLA